ncbi:MAG TPA: penicillin-binding protein 2 [Rhizomicrobium sp.]|jgi:penicillin-binding protein 2|nr:penicillin-binding protein 2 [Rhizomicrobium sp.]
MPLFDRKDKSRYATFTRRSLGMSAGVGVVFAILGGRLYQLQVKNGDQYKTQAEANRINQRLISPPRGRIMDRFGVELANNRRNYRVLIVSEQATEGVDEALDTISKLIVLTDAQKKRVMHDIAMNKKFVPVPVAENLSWEEFARINMHLPYLPGVQPDVGQTRDYPYGQELAHILGYVAAVSPDDIKDNDDPMLALPGSRIGKRGIEKAFDDEVRGTAGVSRVEVNAYGRIIRELSKDPGVPGQDVWLTIDKELQVFTDQQMGDESAACVVLDAQTGDVLALSSSPGYDPNLFNVGITQVQWDALNGDDHKPLMNKALSGSYPPGSTFKPAMALAAVQNGFKDLRVNCTGAMTIGNHQFHCWKKGGHGGVDLKRGIAQSCDVYFYEVAKQLGIDRMATAARALGLGATTGIEIPGENAGFIPDAAWKEARFGIPWQLGETLVTGIGQGYVLTTPLQLATLAARIASGRAVMPRIVHTVGSTAQPRPLADPLPFSDEAFAMVREGMNAVVNEGGTAHGFAITEPGMQMAGKTGTAQVRVITKAERASGVKKNGALPWKMRDHGLFIAFAPVDQPRYAIACIVEHHSDGHPQVKIAQNVLRFAQQRDPLRLRATYPASAAMTGAPAPLGDRG